MTKDEIIQMAREAGFNWPEVHTTTTEQRLERFAALAASKAAAEENEACALICDELQQLYNAHKDTALRNRNVELSLVASGGSAACELLVKTVRARHNTQKQN